MDCSSDCPVVSERARAYVPPGDLPDADVDARIVALPDETSHYFRDVLRLDTGDAVELFDGDGRVLHGDIARTDPEVRISVESDRIVPEREGLDLEIVQAIPKKDRWRWILEKGTELGAARIVPVETERTVVRIPDDRVPSKLERWHRIVGNAARQSGRLRTPDLDAPRDFDRALELAATARNIVLASHSDAPPLGRITDALEADTVRIWVGPEGGWTDGELAALTDRGVRSCHLGWRTLRAETAPLVATALLQDRLGDLRDRNAPFSRLSEENDDV